jgi:hypothetical protein
VIYFNIIGTVADIDETTPEDPRDEMGCEPHRIFRRAPGLSQAAIGS